MDGEGSGLPPSGGSPRAPGWYPDRFRSNEQRYWTGSEWSGRRRWIVDRWLPAEEPSEVDSERVGASSHPSHRGRWLVAAALVVVAAVGAAFAVGAFSSRSATTQSAVSPTTAPGVKTSPRVLLPGQTPTSQPATTSLPPTCSVTTPGRAYPLSGQGIYAISSTLPLSGYTVSISDGLGGAANDYSGRTDASGNALAAFTVPSNLGFVGYVDVTFASGTQCRTSFIAEAKQ